MPTPCLTLLSLILLTGMPLFGNCQQDYDEHSDEAKIQDVWKAIAYRDSKTALLKFPKRKHDSPLFCDEMESYKDGFIINSITSSREHGHAEVITSFYFFDMKSGKLSRLKIPGVDTIESLITDGKNGLYCSYLKGGHRNIEYNKDGIKSPVTNLAGYEIKMQLDTADWVKFGIQNEALYILTPEAVFLFAENKWTKITNFKIADYFTTVLHYRRYHSFLPTRNITIDGDYLWFLQEYVQLRECRLLKLNLKTGELNDYFTMLGFTDLTLKQVNDYCHLPGGAVLVTASRLMDRNLLLKSTVTGSEVWLFNNTVKNISGDLIDLSLSTSLPAGDSIFLAGPQGLYLKTTSDLHPLLRWRSSHQEIIEKQYKMDFDFLPRSLKRISAARFIAGGMWGGLYLLDLVQNKITCLDDVSYDKVENMDLTEL